MIDSNIYWSFSDSWEIQMVRLLSRLPIILLAVFTFGCEEAPPPKSATSETMETTLQNKNTPTDLSNIKIALVMKTLTNPFFISMEKGARKAEKELGITLLVKTAAQETSTIQQINIVDKLIREGNISAIVIAPASSVKLIPSLKRAQDKGIHVINIDNMLDPVASEVAGLKKVPFISVDNEKSAYLSVRTITMDTSQPTEAGILEGIQDAVNAQARKRGALKAFSENSNIQVVASETAHWKIDEAYEVTKKMFKDHPNISVLFCANDMMALGAIEYLRETNRKSVRIAASDAIDEARLALKTGWLDVTIDQQPSMQGYEGIMAAMRSILGEEPKPVTLLEGLIISQ